MNTEPMRALLSDEYQGIAWKRKVAAMHDLQVYAAWRRISGSKKRQSV